MFICFGYDSDLEQMYAFYCARYENISFKEFLKLDLVSKNEKEEEKDPIEKVRLKKKR